MRVLLVATALVCACSSHVHPDLGDIVEEGHDAGGGWGWQLGSGDDAAISPPEHQSTIQPTFPDTTIASAAPPPISGGTLLVTRDGALCGHRGSRSRSRLTVDLASGDTIELRLTAGDEPGRVIEDGAGRIHVALRRGGAVVTIAGGAIVDSPAGMRRAARGLAWDSARDLIHVACASGELVSLPAAGGVRHVPCGSIATCAT